MQLPPTVRPARGLAFQRPAIQVLCFATLCLSGCREDAGDATPAPSPGFTAIVFEPLSIPGGVEGDAVDVQLDVYGGEAPLRFEPVEGALPQGLYLERDTGRIHGTFVRSGDYSVTLRVRDSVGQEATQTVTTSVSDLTPTKGIACGESLDITLTESAFVDGFGHRFLDPDQIQFVALDWVDAAPTSIELAVSTDPSTPTGDPALFVGRQGVSPGNPQRGYYTLESVRPGDEALRIHSQSSPSLADYQNSGGKLAIAVAATQPGTFHLTTRCVTGPIVVDEALDNAVPGEAYEDRLELVSGQAPYVFEPVSLPGWLSLSAEGEFSGTPTEPGLESVSFRVTDAAGQVTTWTRTLQVLEVLSLACDGSWQPVSFSSRAFDGYQGLATPGGAVFFRVEVPDGASEVHIEARQEGGLAVALLEAAPTAAPASSRREDYVRYYEDSSFADDAAVGFHVDPSTRPSLDAFSAGIPVALAADGASGSASVRATCSTDLQPSAQGLAAGQVGTLFVGSLVARGGTPPYLWNAAGSLPEGLVLAADGTLTGIPLESGSWMLSAEVTDAEGHSADLSFFWTAGAVEGVPGCGAATPLTCDDFLSARTSVSGWINRVEADFSSEGTRFFCLEREGLDLDWAAVTLELSNSSGDTDLFLGLPETLPGDPDSSHYRAFSSLEGDDSLVMASLRWPAASAYGEGVAVAAVSWEAGQYLLSVLCE